MSISSGRSARDLAGAIGCPTTRRVEELLVRVVGDNGGRKESGKKAERGREHSGIGMRGLGVVPLCNNQKEFRTVTLGTVSSSAAPLNAL